MRVKELIEALKEYEDENPEVEFAIWNREKAEKDESHKIEDVAFEESFNPILYLWDK